MRYFLLCLPIIFCSSCSNSESEVYENDIPSQEKILVVENGVYDAYLHGDSILTFNVQIDSNQKMEEFSEVFSIGFVPGSIEILDSILRIVPFVRDSIEHGFYEYYLNRNGNEWNVEYRDYLAKDSLDLRYHGLDEELFTQSMSFHVSEYNGLIKLSHDDLTIELISKIKLAE